MAIRFKCPKCGAVLTVKDELAGKQGRCPACKNAVTAPRLAPARRQVEEIEELELVEEEIEEAELIEEEIEEAELVDDRPRRPSGIQRRQDVAVDSRRPPGIKRRPDVEEEDEQIEEVEYGVVEDEPRRPRRRTRRKKLGNLAQAARSKHLQQVRGILLVIGILTIMFNAILFFTAEAAVDAAIKKEINNQGGNVQVDPQVKQAAVRLTQIFAGGFFALGVLYIVFALIVHQYPVPITVTALVIYVGGSIITLAVNLAQSNANAATLLIGLPVRILIIVGLAKGIQAAIVYQKERDEGVRARVRTRTRARDEDDDDDYE